MSEARHIAAPRLLRLRDAADYCGVSVLIFQKTVRLAVPPVFLASATRWDRRALDKWLDKQSGIEPEYAGGGGAYEQRERRKRAGGPA